MNNNNLTPSDTINIKGIDQTVDLSVTASSAITTGSVNGQVYELIGEIKTPITDANVIVYDSANTSVGRAITNTNGKYTITDLANGTYTIVATKNGYQTISPSSITINDIIPITKDFQLTADDKNNLNHIYGTITGKDNTKINGAEIILYRIDDNTKTLVAATTSISDGSYLLNSISTGEYQLVARQAGYETTTPITITLTTSETKLQDIIIEALPDRQSNIVKGLIKDDQDAPLANACVGLYRIESDKETLIAITYFNTIGEYIFSDVADGTYIVKAKTYEIK